MDCTDPEDGLHAKIWKIPSSIPKRIYIIYDFFGNVMLKRGKWGEGGPGKEIQNSVSSTVPAGFIVEMLDTSLSCFIN